jgi:monovalent cation:H+ antiporter-2, CPA2 family
VVEDLVLVLQPSIAGLLNPEDTQQLGASRLWTFPLAELPMSVDKERLTGQVVLIGHGRVDRRIAAALTERNIPHVVADENREIVEALRAGDFPTVSGNAAEPSVLIQAHIARAGMLIIAMTKTLQARRMVEIARMLNPGVEVIVRSHNEEEAEMLRRDGIATVFTAEQVLAGGMAKQLLARYG